MAKPRTLANSVAAGGPLANGDPTITDVTGLQAALDAKLDDADIGSTVQAQLVSGSNIKTVGGQSILGSGNIDTTSNPSFVASGAIASAGLAVALRSDGKVEVVTGQSISSQLGSQTIFDGGTTDHQCAVYHQASNRVVIFFKSGTVGYATVGTVSGTSISFGLSYSFTSELYSIDAAYDSVNQKIVVVWRGASNHLKAIVGTVSGSAITFGSIATQADTSYDPSIAYDPLSGKMVICATNIAASDAGNVYFGTVSGTSISISYTNTVANFVSYLKPVSVDASGKMLFFYTNTNNSSRGTAVVGTISGSSITFGTPVAFTAGSLGSSKSGIAIPNASSVLLAYYGNAQVFVVSGTSVSFGSAVSYGSSGPFVSVSYYSIFSKFVIAYQDGNNGFAKYRSVSVSGTSISLDSAITFGGTDVLELITSAYDGSSIVFAYRNSSISNGGYAIVAKVAGVNTNANGFIGFAQAAAADGASVKVATEASIDANQTGLTVGAKYYVNFDGTLTTTVTAYPVAGTGLSASRIQVATAPDFAPATVTTGSLIFLQELTAANTAELDLTAFSSTYDDYIVTFQNAQSGVNTNDRVACRLQTDGVWRTTASYAWALHYLNPGSSTYSQVQSTSTNVIAVTRGIGSSPTYSPSAAAAGMVKILGVNSTTRKKGVLFESYHNSTEDSTYDVSCRGHGVWTASTGVVTGIRFFMTGSNLITGTFRLYGIKKS